MIEIELAKKPEVHAMMKKETDTPNLVKLAYWCNCTVEELVAELKKIMQQDDT